MKQIARKNFEVDDKQLSEKLAKTNINPSYFSGGAVQVGFKIILDSHKISHANSEIIILPNFPELPIESDFLRKS